MSVSVCTDNEDDWMEFLDMVANSFQNSIPFLKSHPDAEKRRKFLFLLHRLLYEAELSNNRAGLACLKAVASADSNARPKIIYGSCIIYGEYNDVYKQSDIAKMCEIDPKGWKIYERQGVWEEKEIYQKMNAITHSLNIACLYGIFHATAKDYMGRALAKKYGGQAMMKIYEDGIKRGAVDGNKPAIFYCIVDDIRAKNTAMTHEQEVIAHLHFCANKTSTVRCVNDPEKRKPIDVDCVFVLARELTGKTDLLSKIRKMFSNKAHL